MKLTALKTINQLKRALGPNSPELETIKSSFVSNLMKVDAADPRAFAKTAMQVNDFINGRGSVVARSLLTKDEYSVLNRFASVMKDAGTMPKGQLEKEISIIGQTIKMSAPAIASGLSTFLGIMHPVLATAISAPFYAKQGLDLVKNFLQSQEEMRTHLSVAGGRFQRIQVFAFLLRRLRNNTLNSNKLLNPQTKTQKAQREFRCSVHQVAAQICLLQQKQLA